MSADLFAEFNNPPSGQPQQKQPQPQNNFQANSVGNQQDPFDFLSSSNTKIPQPQQLSQQWSGLQSQPSGTSNWGSGSAFGTIQSPTQAADEDDGWGDFETAGDSINKPTQPVQPSPLSWETPAPSSGCGKAAEPDPWESFGQKPVAPAQPSPISWQTSAQSDNGRKPAEQDPWGTSGQKSLAQTQPDPWSMFEQAESTQNKPQPKPLAAFKHPEPGRLVRASTMDIMTNNLVGMERSSKPSSPVKPEPPSYEAATRSRFKEPTNPNIMFDAQDFELEGGDEDDDFDDDEFGDFETVSASKNNSKPVSKASAPKPSQPPPSMDLLSLMDDAVSPPAPPPPPEKSQPNTKPSKPLGFGATITQNSAQGTGHSKTSSISKTLKESRPVVAEDEEWGAWDEFESKPPKKVAKPQPPAPVDNWDWEATDPTATSRNETKEDEAPPINVPPPSVLLSAFPSLFDTGNALFKPVSAQTPSIKERILSDPKAVDFLRGYILIATTAGHVIAGRKHRWHRDKILAKSMSISAAGSKGMKLAGVDKTQTKREDREAADVAIAWGEHVGRLRSAVAAANSSGKSSLKVPEISENMQVQTAKMTPTAAKPCIICGLKREERVSKVDFDIEDSFGEWWVEHWGHRACKNFWQQHEQMLRQR